MGILISYNWPDRTISHVHHPHCHSLNIKQKKVLKKTGEISYYLAVFGTLCQRDRVTNRFSLWLFILNAGLNEIWDKSSPLAHSGEWRLIASRSFSELINETERQTDELMALPVSLLTSEDSLCLPLRTGLRGVGKCFVGNVEIFWETRMRFAVPRDKQVEGAL